MTKEEADRLIDTIRGFVGGPAPSGDQRRVLASAPNGAKLVTSQRPAAPEEPSAASDEERQFERFKAWLLRDLEVDPVFVRLLANAPELEVQFTPKTVTLTDDTLRGRVARLMAQGWFDSARSVGGCRAELKRTGSDPGGGGTLGQILNQFVVERFMVRVNDGFALASGVKIREREMVSE